MAFDYTTLRDESVEPLLAEFGRPATIQVDGVRTSTGYNPQPARPVSHAVTVVQTGFNKADNQGTVVEMGDVMFLVSTQGVIIDPALANRITVAGVEYQIVRIDPVRPGEVVLLWKVHARK